MPGDSEPCCTHCGLPVPPALRRAEHAGEGPQFCCAGCRSVYGLLGDWGLGDFYRLRDEGQVLRPEARRPAAESGARDDDEAAALARHQRLHADGVAECNWAVGGMHCAACVWLLEQLPRLRAGVYSARVDFAANRVTVLADPERVPPIAQRDLLRRLGYHPAPWRDDAAREQARLARRDWILRCTVSAGSALSTMHLGFGLLAGHATGDLDPGSKTLLHLLTLLLALPALSYGAMPFYRTAIAGLRAGRATLELSIALVIVVGIVASVAALFGGGNASYADALAMFVALLLGGRLVFVSVNDRIAERDAGAVGLLPEYAHVIGDDGTPRLRPTDELRPGMRVLLRSGELAPCDGTVISGSAAIDSAVLSGESRPIHVGIGDELWAGCRCRDGDATILCSAASEASRLGTLLAQLRRGAWQPTPIARLVDRLQAIYAPAVTVLAIGVWLLWRSIDPSRAWEQAVALVLACCPCALGLATPLCYALAGRRAARHGILLRDGGSIENLGRPQHVVFDKTGTLTEGRFRVVDWRWRDEVDAVRRRDVAAVLLAAEQRARHPIADALVERLRAEGIEPAPLSAWREVPGSGLICSAGIGDLRIGKAAFVGLDAAAADADSARIGIAVDGAVVAELLVQDPVKRDADALVATLQQRGIVVHLLSGDEQQRCSAVAARLGIAPERAIGDCSPEDKARRVAELAREGATVMIGDGVNDAPALGAAHVGVGLRGGLEAALGSGSAYLLDPAPATIALLFAGARSARQSLRHTLASSLLYNLVAVAAVAAGWWGPYVCAVAMPLSSLAVLAQLMAARSFAGAVPAVSSSGAAAPAPEGCLLGSR